MSLAFLITQVCETRFSFIKGEYVSVIYSLVVFSIAQRVALNVEKTRVFESNAYSDSQFLKASFSIIKLAEEQFSQTPSDSPADDQQSQQL